MKTRYTVMGTTKYGNRNSISKYYKNKTDAKRALNRIKKNTPNYAKNIRVKKLKVANWYS